MSHCVEVVKFDNEEVVKRLGPMTERKAGKVEDGIEINLNRDEYFTRVIAEEKQ